MVRVAAAVMVVSFALIRAAPGALALEANTQDAFVRRQLADAVLLLDRHFRVPSTGQYLDQIDLTLDRQTEQRSSIAATGVGLVSLAIGDRLGLVDHAGDKAELTLHMLLGKDPAATFHTERSPGGWFHHWIDARTGRAVGKEKDRTSYSTIDTAILAAGAWIAGRYFADRADQDGDDAAARVSQLSDELLRSMQWSEAVRDIGRGTIQRVFYGQAETPDDHEASELFDEYVILPCLGRFVDGMTGSRSASTLFWERHLADVRKVPTKPFEGQPLLSVSSNSFVPDFAPQFAFYFCPALASDPAFLDQMAALRDADRRWFVAVSHGVYPPRWWGLGAGSAVVPGLPRQGSPLPEPYEAATLDRNVDRMISPAIIAGFAPLDRLAGHPGPVGQRTALDDLQDLAAHRECVYAYQGLSFLWRCSALDMSRKVRFVQAVDFSTYLFGLAELEFGPRLFQSPFRTGASVVSRSTNTDRVHAALSRAFWPRPMRSGPAYPGTSGMGRR